MVTMEMLASGRMGEGVKLAGFASRLNIRNSRPKEDS